MSVSFPFLAKGPPIFPPHLVYLVSHIGTCGLLPSGALVENVARILSSFAGDTASFLSSVYLGQVGGKRHADIQKNHDFTSILALAVSP